MANVGAPIKFILISANQLRFFFPGWMFLHFIHACLEYWKRRMPTDRRGAQSEREVVMSPQLQIEKNCERMERRKVEQ